MSEHAAPPSSDDDRLRVLELTDEVIGLAAEIDELRARVVTASDRATAAAEVSQRAEVTAERAAAQIDDIGEYLATVTDGLGAAPVPVPADGAGTDLDALSRDDLIARVRHLEAVLSRRSMRSALWITQKLRGS